MKANEAVSTHPTTSRVSRHAGKYRKVLDGRKQRIRGLWERNGSYYGQLTVDDPATGQKIVKRVRLEDQDGKPVSTAAEAVKRLNALKTQRDEGVLKLDPRRTPTFSEYAKTYRGFFESVKDLKRPNTIRRENVCLRALEASFGHLHLRQINKAVVNAHIASRQAAGLSGRSCNLELVTLRNVLHRAVDDGYLSALPIEGLKWLKHTPKRKRLLSHAELDRIRDTALAVAPVSGRMFADFVRIMAYSGGRWMETLRLRWSDVDFSGRQLTFGGDGLSKNHQARTVDFNAKLESCLLDMATRKQPDSVYMFPSPRRGDADLPTRTFNKVLRTVREKAGMPDFTCHSLRHYFVSTAVMSGIDYMTIARWVGHQDGGVLIGKVYGHLSNEHAQAQAARLNFGPTVLPLAQAATA